MNRTFTLLGPSLRRCGTMIAAAFVGLTLLGAPAQAQNLNPFRPPSVEDQKKLGDQAAAQILQKYPEVKDSRASHFKDVCQRLVSKLSDNDRKTWNFRFHLIESDEINAFALPGGETFMFTGLYKQLTSDDALAAVMGHELTHVRQQHWARAESENQKRNALIGAGLILFKANQTQQAIGASVTQVIGLKYSRGDEDAADKGGLENMVAAGYNPQGMLDLFATLQKVSGNGGDKRLGDFLSDHPLTSSRIDNTKKRIAAMGKSNFPALTPLPGGKKS